jgi:S-adenosylmethionine:tRNA-ribosyltransferase-isomerase (queuine synthetase)
MAVKRQGFSSVLGTLRAELKTVESQIPALQNRRVKLLAAIDAIEKIQDPNFTHTVRALQKGKRLVAGEATGKTAREVLREKGPLKIEELVELMRQRGWKSTGNPDRDIKRVYHSMYNNRKVFRVRRPQNLWELVK